jgi:hypothetical protein
MCYALPATFLAGHCDRIADRNSWTLDPVQAAIAEADNYLACRVPSIKGYDFARTAFPEERKEPLRLSRNGQNTGGEHARKER